MACEVLGGITGVERVWNLPSSGTSYAVVSSALTPVPAWSGVKSHPIERVTLRDRWGKLLLGHRLDEYASLSFPPVGAARAPQLQSLDPAVSLVRCRPEEGGVACQLSDGTELACTGVVFADGPRSVARTFLERALVARKEDRKAVVCWSFVRRDLLDLNAWEFRTALGKSVEQMPLPEGKVRVKLRFKTNVGARQTASQLRELFSEFGPDIEALLDGVADSEISHWIDEDPAQVSFCPLPGTLALGQAALGVPLLESFDWALKLGRRQMERVVESVVVDRWDPTAWEPAFVEAWLSLQASERYLRSSLHYDNALFRPLRDVALRLLPAGILTDRVKSRLAI